MNLLSRRQFVATGAAFAAALPIALAVTRRIKVAFLGTAYSHYAEKHKVLSASPDWYLVAYSDAEVIVIESDVPHHGRDALRALTDGRHVHIEKPPASTLDDMRRIVQLVREKNRLLQVGYQWRYNPGFEKILEAARNNWLGDIFQVRANMHTRLEEDRRAEWAGLPGGSMFEQGSHLIDPIIRLLGRPKSVKPFLQRRGNDALSDNNVAVFEFDKALAIVTNSVLQPNANAHRAFEVAGSNGTAVLGPIEPPTLTIDLAKAAGPYRAGTQTVALPPYQRYVRDFADFAAAVRGDKSLPTSLDQELLVQEWLLKACGVE
ncbi:MAG TPA: Gfo/Idh/MocA family oxidoreductase [Verrucomicrobiae bacterium]|nr:Gfo/Idh/MocA family oxidoreductase [Verrucomicrobiae bacterium]